MHSSMIISLTTETINMKENNSFWMPKAEAEAWRDWQNRFWNGMLFGATGKRIPEEDENVKLAWVVIDGQRTMVGLDRVTKKAYKLRDDMPTWIRPLQEISYDSFERWCTTFDV
jgi:hypothetical protein